MKALLGPVKVFAVKGIDVFIFTKGSVRKVLRCNVQICETNINESEEEKKQKEDKVGDVEFGREEDEDQKGFSVWFDEQNFEQNISKEDVQKK